MKKQTFQHSSELKKLFNRYFDAWSKKHRLTLGELAERCGVSTQYLAHIGRYGRIPGKPILILLALVLEVPDPSEFFRAASVAEVWPFDQGVGLRPPGAAESGFFSVNFDTAGFTNMIRDLLRAELRPKSLNELLSGRALRVGLNRGQSFFFSPAGKQQSAVEGFFPELVRLLALSLHCVIEFKDVLHSEFSDNLNTDGVDIFGPVYFTPSRMSQALFTNPFCNVEIGGLWRTAKIESLPSLPMPKNIVELRKKEYRIAVHRESMSHHFALSELGIPDDRLIPCEIPEESLERILLTRIPRPAHLLLTDRPHAFQLQKENPELKEIPFSASDPQAPPYEDTIAVRPDWPSVVTLLNEMLDFLKRNGSIQRLYRRSISEEIWPGIIISQA